MINYFRFTSLLSILIYTCVSHGYSLNDPLINIPTLSQIQDMKRVNPFKKTQITHHRTMQSELISINYAKASDIALMLKESNTILLSKYGAIGVDNRTNSLWLKDFPERIQSIKSLINKIDVPAKQVIIEARIINMAKDCARDIGIRWGLSKSNDLNTDILPTDGHSHRLDHLNLDLAAIPLDASPGTLGIALAKLGNHIILDLELSALESEGKAEIIASPRLMTINQQAAIIESGEDIPYQESTLGGGTSVAFKKAVLKLKATPHITPDGNLLIDLLINQDSDSGRRVQGVPVILTKSIETSVLVSNGQTIVLGGIYQQDRNNAMVRIPFVGRLPWIGHLFTRQQKRKRMEELLIFITPKIVDISYR